MRSLRAAVIRVRNLFKQRRLEQDLADELGSHLQLHIDDNLRAGLPPDEARRQAILAIGGLEATKERCRDRRGIPFLDHLARDVQYGFRTLRRNPGFTTAAVISLALGLGANMAIFRFVNAVLLESLPVPRADRLVLIGPWALNYPMYREIAASTGSVFAGTAARWTTLVTLADGGMAERLPAEIVSGSYFRTLGVRAAVGRLLDVEDDGTEGAHRVCVISYDLWQRRFGGDPAVLGRTIRLNAEAIQIVGVTERGFHGAELHARYDVQIPMSMTRVFAGMARDSSDWTWLRMMARRAPGVSKERAQAVVRATFKPTIDFMKEQPLTVVEGRQGIRSLRPKLENPVLIAQMLAGFILLIACANLTSLLLAKTSARRREIALRRSLGASRGRLVAQLLVESVLLAGGGAAVGTGVATLLGQILSAMLSAPGSNVEFTSAPAAVRLSAWVGVSVATAVAIGLLPALVSTRESPLDGLRESTGAAPSRWLAGRWFTVMQIMACLVLVSAAGLFARSLHNLRGIDLGLDARHVVVLTTDPEQAGYSEAQTATFYDAWLRHARLVPGVSSAALASITALSGKMFAGAVRVPQSTPHDGPEPNNNLNIVSADYFRTVGLRLVAGRTFTDHDGPNAPRVVVVNQRFADYYWAGRSAVGRRFTLFANREVEVVGVVRTAKYSTVREAPQITIYLPLGQLPTSELTLHARVAGEPKIAAAALRRAVREIDPNVPLYDVAVLEDYVDARLSNDRVLSALSTAFASIALIVACAGLYGLVSYAVIRRRREIGIRLAVGAPRRAILALFTRDALTLVGAGIALGIPLSLAVGRQFRSLLYGIEPSGVPMLISATALLAIVSMAAVAVPAARATRLDPADTLRQP